MKATLQLKCQRKGLFITWHNSITNTNPEASSLLHSITFIFLNPAGISHSQAIKPLELHKVPGISCLGNMFLIKYQASVAVNFLLDKTCKMILAYRSSIQNNKAYA